MGDGNDSGGPQTGWNGGISQGEAEQLGEDPCQLVCTGFTVLLGLTDSPHCLCCGFPVMSFISLLKLSKDVVKLAGMCEAAVGGWGTLVFEVGEGLYVSPHLVGLVASFCRPPWPV